MNKESPLSIMNCIVCKEPLFLTPPSQNPNEEILNKIMKFLKKKGLDEKEIEKLNNLKNVPICRWDLFSLISRLINEKELKGFFEKLVCFYDFDNPKEI